MKTSEKVKDFFDIMANDRDMLFNTDPVFNYEQFCRCESVFKLLFPSKSDIILETGCGNARDLVLLSKKNIRCYGVDFSNEMLKEAKEKLNKRNIHCIKIMRADVKKLPFPSNYFSKVFSSEVIEHIPDFSAAIAEMIRVLKPGGLLVLTTPNRKSIYGFERYIILEKILRKKWAHPYDEWKTFKELKKVLIDNNMEIKQIRGTCYLPGFLISYRLPLFFKQVLVNFISKIEPIARVLFPKNGYMIAISAEKK